MGPEGNKNQFFLQGHNQEWHYGKLNIFAKNILYRTYFLFKNGGRGNKPTYIFMVIIPLLVIELKATPNDNPNDDFYWRQKSSSLNLVQIIPPVGL